ncbi:hypothetical protein BH11PSE3_BH11PSE3_31180 [soil metagenome]
MDNCNFRWSLQIAALLTIAGIAGALAQTAVPIEFRLIAAKANMAGCSGLDTSLSRVHAITLMGETAQLKSSGGINDTLKQTSPSLYKTVFTLGGIRLDVVADASKTPRSLTVTDAQRGCHWNAEAR